MRGNGTKHPGSPLGEGIRTNPRELTANDIALIKLVRERLLREEGMTDLRIASILGGELCKNYKIIHEKIAGLVNNGELKANTNLTTPLGTMTIAAIRKKVGELIKEGRMRSHQG